MIIAPLTKSQFGIYAECVSHQGEVCYNLPYIYELDGSLDGERLVRAIETAVKAHPTLFTRISVNDDGEPMQTIDDTETFELTIEDIDDIETVKPSRVVPINIYGDRLFHIRLLKDANHYYYFQDLHHIIVDGTSMQVILSDVDAAYRGEPLAPESLTMAEVAQKEAELRQTSAFEEGKQWYAQNFDCGDTFTQLMPDLEIAEHAEASQLRTLSVDMSQVDAFCKETKSANFTVKPIFITTKGLADGMYSKLISFDVTLEDLFEIVK